MGPARYQRLCILRFAKIQGLELWEWYIETYNSKPHVGSYNLPQDPPVLQFSNPRVYCHALQVPTREMKKSAQMDVPP